MQSSGYSYYKTLLNDCVDNAIAYIHWSVQLRQACFELILEQELERTR